MRYLLFHIGTDCYALPASAVAQVLPLLALKEIPQAPAYVAGLMNLHGAPVPVIDLCMLGCGAACSPLFDTRVILANYREGLLGLIAERVVGIARIDDAAWREPGIAAPEAPYLGRVAAAGEKIVQLIEVEQLLPDAVRALLIQQPRQAERC